MPRKLHDVEPEPEWPATDMATPEWAALNLVRPASRLPANQDDGAQDARSQAEPLTPRSNSNREAVLAAVQKDGLSLEFAAEELQGDVEIVLAAVKQSQGAALEYAAGALRNDEAFMLRAIYADPSAVKYASEQLKESKAIVMAAVTHFGFLVQHAAEPLKTDPEIVLAARKQTTSNPREWAYWGEVRPPFGTQLINKALSKALAKRCINGTWPETVSIPLKQWATFKMPNAPLKANSFIWAEDEGANQSPDVPPSGAYFQPADSAWLYRFRGSTPAAAPPLFVDPFAIADETPKRGGATKPGDAFRPGDRTKSMRGMPATTSKPDVAKPKPLRRAQTMGATPRSSGENIGGGTKSLSKSKPAAPSSPRYLVSRPPMQ